MRRSRILAIILIAGPLVAVLVLMVVSTSQNPTSQDPANQIVQTAPVPPANDAARVVPAPANRALPSSPLRPANYDQLHSETRALIDKEIERWQQALAVTPPPRNTDQPPFPLPTPNPRPQLAPGQASSADFPAGSGWLTDRGNQPWGYGYGSSVELGGGRSWYENQDLTRTRLSSGTLRADPHQGVVVIQVNTPGSDRFQSYLIHTPTRVGNVQIVGADGRRLTLVAEDGTSFVFDVDSRTFVTP